MSALILIPENDPIKDSVNRYMMSLLPDDIIYNIYSFLGMSDCINGQITCKRFDEIIKKLPKLISLYIYRPLCLDTGWGLLAMNDYHRLRYSD